MVLTGRVACYIYGVFRPQKKISIAHRLFAPLDDGGSVDNLKATEVGRAAELAGTAEQTAPCIC